MPAKAAKPTGAKPAKASPAAPPPASAPMSFAKDDDDDHNPYTAIRESEAPRCPHCAKDLDTPDAIICLHCGYDLRERKRKEARAVVEDTFFDYVMHHIGVVALLVFVIALDIFGIYSTLQMRSWLTDSFLDAGEKEPTTQAATFHVPPFCFNVWIITFLCFVTWKTLKVAFRRFFINYRPPEKVIKKSED